MRGESSLRLAFWRDSPARTHRDFSSLSVPPAFDGATLLAEKHIVVSMQQSELVADVYDTWDISSEPVA